ncbi:MAG: hypothetical protein KJ767_04115 [Nanoarchaeota archaeon]|nr:hypothetical protein [Nanoarchaeota archaeon]
MNYSSEINKLMQALDNKSKAIVLYTLQNRYAKIRELSNLTSEDDSQTLTRIKEVINSKAREILDKPLLIFKESKIDFFSGEKILFSWWLAEEINLVKREKEMLDIFDEKDILRVVAEMPGIDKKNLKLTLYNNTLKVYADPYNKEIPLFYPIQKIANKSYKNGILEVTLIKKNNEN